MVLLYLPTAIVLVLSIAIAHRLANRLLPHLLLSLLAANALVENLILTARWRIIITLVSCVGKILSGLIHAVLVLLVLYLLLLLA